MKSTVMPASPSNCPSPVPVPPHSRSSVPQGSVVVVVVGPVVVVELVVEVEHVHEVLVVVLVVVELVVDVVVVVEVEHVHEVLVVVLVIVELVVVDVVVDVVVVLVVVVATGQSGSPGCPVQVHGPALHWARIDDLQALRAAPDKPAHPAAISSEHAFAPQIEGAALAPETKTPAPSATAANVTPALRVIVEPPCGRSNSKIDFGALPPRVHSSTRLSRGFLGVLGLRDEGSAPQGGICPSRVHHAAALPLRRRAGCSEAVGYRDTRHGQDGSAEGRRAPGAVVSPPSAAPRRAPRGTSAARGSTTGNPYSSASARSSASSDTRPSRTSSPASVPDWSDRAASASCSAVSTPRRRRISPSREDIVHAGGSRTVDRQRIRGNASPAARSANAMAASGARRPVQPARCTRSRRARAARAPARQPIGSSMSGATTRAPAAPAKARNASSARRPPRLAPALVPRMDGSARGLRKRPWTTAPPPASVTPAMKAAAKRAPRSSRNVRASRGFDRSPVRSRATRPPQGRRARAERRGCGADARGRAAVRAATVRPAGAAPRTSTARTGRRRSGLRATRRSRRRGPRGSCVRPSRGRRVRARDP